MTEEQTLTFFPYRRSHVSHVSRTFFPYRRSHVSHVSRTFFPYRRSHVFSRLSPSFLTDVLTFHTSLTFFPYRRSHVSHVSHTFFPYRRSHVSRTFFPYECFSSLEAFYSPLLWRGGKGVRLYFYWYALGDSPYFLVKQRVKYFGSLKPTRKAISEMLRLPTFSLRMRRARSRR